MVTPTRYRPLTDCYVWAMLLIAQAIAGSPSALDAAEPLPRIVAFNRDIRPILSDTCYHCHGPDATVRKADLRLDMKTGAFADLGDYRAIVPGDIDNSELYQRIITENEDEQMPPVDSARKLTQRQRDLIRLWIEQGAKWQEHWAFIAPRRPALPEVQDQAGGRNAIDAFVLARLEHNGLLPSPTADKTALIRRVTLDLTGLPPTLEKIDAFLADQSPDAYEKVADRLLTSPRFGEHMATYWLDAARYADTNGYQTDGVRVMWRWRDWVIEALNNNMPFDQFTIEQLAGDLLPDATLDQKIATGFNRNHRGNSEGGIIPEEFAVEYVVDRVETVATVWLGLTMGCTRCHEHKYDPLSQEEFYQFFAFFNNIPENGRAIKIGNSMPYIKTPTRRQQAQLDELQRDLRRAETEFANLQQNLDTAQLQWEKSLQTEQPIDWSFTDHLATHYQLDDGTSDQTGHAQEGKFQDGDPAYAPGRLGQAGRFDGRRFIDAGDVGHFGFFDKFSCGAWIFPTGVQHGSLLSRMTDIEQEIGYQLCLQDGKVQVNLVKRWLDDAIRVETRRQLTPGRWHHVMMTYDGSRIADGVKIYIDGRLERLKVNLDGLNQTFKSKEPFRIGGGGGPQGRFQGDIDEVRVYDGCLSALEVEVVACADAITDMVAIPSSQRSPQQANKLRTYFLEQQAPQSIQSAWKDLSGLRHRRQQVIESFPTTMVMQEREMPRETYFLIRGEYDKPGKKVTAGVPAILHPMPQGVNNDRLGFAKWLVDPANPLMARVIVNRYWQAYFGTGLVKTAEDFGTQGEPPSHPLLLDWLATEFIRSGWDVKALQKMIVMSATYRQSSKVSPQLLQQDPDNRLLARGPRFRLSAQMIRDNALAISGLLVQQLGGPSVKPYQPAGLWKEIADDEYEQDHGDNLYRRSLYTIWKRTVAPPTMMTFDASGREFCTVRVVRTNTPLQALTLMNDVTFVEAARVLAQRMMTAGGGTPEERISFAFRLATARQPRSAERNILLSGFQEHLAAYRHDPDTALKLVSVGEFPRNEQLDTSELAAYTTVAGLILNLDEVVTKE